MALSGCANTTNYNDNNLLKWNEIENKNHVVGKSEGNIGLVKISTHSMYSSEPVVFEVYYDSMPAVFYFDLCKEQERYKKSCVSKFSISKFEDYGYKVDIDLNYIVAERVAELNMPIIKNFSYDGMISKDKVHKANRKEIAYTNGSGDSKETLQELDVIDIIPL